MKEKIKLSGVPETMLQTIYARAKESGGRGTIHDTKAEEIVGKLDYDFTLAEKDTAMHSGVIARTIVLDRLTKAWLSAHPGAVLIDFSASTPGFARELGAVATVSDLGFVEAPIALEDMLDPRPFDEENLVCYVAGEEDAVAAAQGLLNAVCGRVVECGAAGTAQLMRAVRTLQEAAAVVSAIEANALVRAAHRAALGNGLSDVAISGLSEPAESMLEAVREKRFEGAFTADDLYNLVSDLLADPAQLAQMAENMRAAGAADAAERIADLVLKLADRHAK